VVWEFVFMMVILKIPIVYLCLVVYWAVKAEPKPPEPALLPAVVPGQDPPGPWQPRRRRRPRPGPHGSPIRRYARASRSALPLP
jgi:hypothetical protein